MNSTESLPNPYLLLTPGPLTTTASVKAVMLRDWCTWDEDYSRLVQAIRRDLTELATTEPGFTTVLMQGSGTFGVEAALTTAVPREGQLLVLANGAYGRRMAQIAERAGIPARVLESGETSPPDIDRVSTLLQTDGSITHVVRAFYQALQELKAEGGVAARHARYRQNRDALVAGMQTMGFAPLLPPAFRSPIITAFHSPSVPAYDFRRFYDLLKKQGFVIYPGKVTELETFRIGTIGDVHPADIERFITAVDASMYWKQLGA